jgi:hypothetical protein
MNRDSAPYLQEKKKELIVRVEDLTLKLYVKTFQRLYDQAKKRCKETRKSGNVLKEFQNELKGISTWTHSDLVRELDNLKQADEKIDQMILVVFKLTNLLNGRDDHSNIPSIYAFIKESYLYTARALWKNPYLFYDEVSKIERVKNVSNVEDIVKSSIQKTFLKMTPLDDSLIFLRPVDTASTNAQEPHDEPDTNAVVEHEEHDHEPQEPIKEHEPTKDHEEHAEPIKEHGDDETEADEDEDEDNEESCEDGEDGDNHCDEEADEPSGDEEESGGDDDESEHSEASGDQGEDYEIVDYNENLHNESDGQYSESSESSEDEGDEFVDMIIEGKQPPPPLPTRPPAMPFKGEQDIKTVYIGEERREPDAASTDHDDEDAYSQDIKIVNIDNKQLSQCAPTKKKSKVQCVNELDFIKKKLIVKKKLFGTHEARHERRKSDSFF